MTEQRPGRHLGSSVCVDIGVVYEVTRHQVDGTLDAREPTSKRTGQRHEQGGLADADATLEHDVSTAERCNAQHPYGPVLSDHHRLHGRFDCQRFVSPIPETLIGVQNRVHETA